MYSLYFAGREKYLVSDQVHSTEEAFLLMKQYVYELNPNFKIHYVRSWGNNPIIYDVGSHTEFFELYEN